MEKAIQKVSALDTLADIYAKRPETKALSSALQNLTSADSSEPAGDIYLTGLTASSPALTLAALRGVAAPILVILADADEAGYCYQDLTQILGDTDVLFLPSSYRRKLKYLQKDPANEILRTEALTRLNSRSGTAKLTTGGQNADTAKAKRGEATATCAPLLIVSYPEAVAEMVVSSETLAAETLTLRRGGEAGQDSVVRKLREWKFEEVDYVYSPGQFARRGSLLDVFSFSSEYPVRIDFFDTEIETIRSFETDTQLTKDQLQSVSLVPEMGQGASRRESLFEFLPDDTILAAKDFQLLRDQIARIYDEGFSRQALAEQLSGLDERHAAELKAKLKAESMLVPPSTYDTLTDRFTHIHIGTRTAAKTARPSLALQFNTSPQPLFHKQFDMLCSTLRNYREKGYRHYILADSPKQHERLKEIIASVAEGDDLRFTAVKGTLHEGFIDHTARICVFTDHQIFDRFHKYSLKSDRARSGKMALTLKEIRQFLPGDYVVHIDHGIGRFGGLVRVPVGDTTQEMIKIQYAGSDSVYVSIHGLYKVSKYKSQDDSQPPRLSRLGTGQWDQLKEKTKRKLKDIARDLILLYAARRGQSGYAYSADSFMQHELEASFVYEDTPDQLKATNDVKADMEATRPMDRLVCGDVGFGKTEVAVRAAFKAACDSKQVAVLVPTTVLAYQHYQTFAKRLKDMPVKVDYLSRARSPKQTKEILAGLDTGTIDIVIGTQKLLGKTVKFHDLGLLIIDEEQKFGVATKEKLRHLKTNVDTLTMSATPIPRTLQFSLCGARDLSVIQTPPPNRHPILTEIHTFGAEIIAEAINFELSRNGQVFFVNNRISDLEALRQMILKHVPDARVRIGHGQMKPDELEQLVLDFINYDFDVLLSTTIVENGIDIPNANTIIINGAQHFGLSDLHQMRGRVGRGSRKAFCYLLAPPLADLPNDSRRRLEALEAFSDLGSGINIAMQDLDIRGAGNLLGAEQSGFIADLGYETYHKILTQAVNELRDEDLGSGGNTSAENPSEANAAGRKAAQKAASGPFVDDCALDSDWEMYFPPQFVPGDSERMLLYRELDSLTTDAQLAAYRQRLEDRFGRIPAPAEELMRVVPLRRKGKMLGIEKIQLRGQTMTLTLVSRHTSPYYQSEEFTRLLNFATRNPRICNFKEIKGRRQVTISGVKGVSDATDTLTTIANYNL